MLAVLPLLQAPDAGWLAHRHRPPGWLQVKKCADAGADIVRITVQSAKEAEACMRIREQLFKDRCARTAGALVQGL